MRIWKTAQDLALRVYKLADHNEFIKKDFSLKDQLKRCSISISDNIVEGFEYNNNPDFYKFLRIAKGSCGELINKLIFIKKLKYEPVYEMDLLLNDARILNNQIGTLLTKVKSKILSEKRKGK